MHKLDDIKLLYYQENYLESQANVAKMSTSHKDFEAAQLFRVRSLIDQGLMGKADLCISSLTTDVQCEEFKIQLHCYRAFIQALIGETEKQLLDLQYWILNQNSKVQNVSFQNIFFDDFYQRTEWMLIALGIRDQPFWQQTKNKTLLIADNYLEINELENRWQVLLRSASACTKPPFNDFIHAKSCLQLVIDEANKNRQPLFAGNTLLYLGELYFSQIRDNDKNAPDDEDTLQCFQKACELLKQGGHFFAEAKTMHRLGECMLKHGRAEGVEILNNSIERLQKAHAYTEQQSIWRSLQIWYTRTGAPNLAKQASSESQALSTVISLKMGNQVDELGQADLLFRQGKVTKAIDSLDNIIASSTSFTLAVAAASVMSNILGQLNRKQEMIPRLESLIEQMQQHGKTPLLAQTFFNLSNLYDVGDNLAIIHLETALKIYRILGDDVAAAYMLVLIAWQKFQRYRLQNKQGNLVIADEIIRTFEEAQDLLTGRGGIESQEHLAALCQHRGQVHLMVGDYDSCGRWYSLVQDIYDSLGFKPSLAFALINQGLALIELGRKAGPKVYNQAILYFKRAGKLFSESGIDGMIWRTVFYQGLAQYEAGQREANTSKRQLKRWCIARLRFKESADMIDDLRGYSGSDGSLQGQTVGAAFMIDKQTVLQSGFSLAYVSNRPEELITWLERMKARAMLDAMSQTVLPETQILNHPDIKREQSLLLSKAQCENEAEALKIQQKIDHILDRLNNDPITQPYAHLRNGKVTSWKTIQDWLLARRNTYPQYDTLLVSFYCSKDMILAIGMKADWIAPQWERIVVDYNLMSQTIRDYFHTPDAIRIALEDLGEDEWQSLFVLIQPISYWSNPGDIIGLIPHGILHDIPLHTLQIDNQYLIERNPVFYMPSLTVLTHLRVNAFTTLSAPDTVSVFGDPTSDLTNAADEAKIIANLFNTTSVQQSFVTKQTLIDSLTHSNLVHFAGHGDLSAEDGLESGLILANGEKLKAKDLINLVNCAEFIVLSGCETGLSEHRTGDELFGMVRILLLAGVQRLLVSQWRVNDAATQELLKEFYGTIINDPSLPLAIALQNAMLSLRSRYSKWSSFYYWGSFILIGN